MLSSFYFKCAFEGLLKGHPLLDNTLTPTWLTWWKKPTSEPLMTWRFCRHKEHGKVRVRSLRSSKFSAYIAALLQAQGAQQSGCAFIEEHNSTCVHYGASAGSRSTAKCVWVH